MKKKSPVKLAKPAKQKKFGFWMVITVCLGIAFIGLMTFMFREKEYSYRFKYPLIVSNLPEIPIVQPEIKITGAKVIGADNVMNIDPSKGYLNAKLDLSKGNRKEVSGEVFFYVENLMFEITAKKSMLPVDKNKIVDAIKNKKDLELVGSSKLLLTSYYDGAVKDQYFDAEKDDLDDIIKKQLVYSYDTVFNDAKVDNLNKDILGHVINQNDKRSVAKAIYDYFQKNYTYDSQFLKENKVFTVAKYPQDIYRVIDQKKGICTNLSHLYSLLLDKNGIENRLVYGVTRAADPGEIELSNDGHVWTQVYINDKWMDVDPSSKAYFGEPIGKVTAYYMAKFKPEVAKS